MKHILVLGAGQSTPYLIANLLENAVEYDWFITVCDRDLQLAQQRVTGNARGQAISLDINNVSTRSSLISKANVVINMLTRPYQHAIALECLNNGSHMLTASYEDPLVRDFDSDAHRKNILILNEMGLDPGIDHMAAMSLIQKTRARGGNITSFKSYGSGLPAPDTQTNPLKYVITWNPRNVLLAGEDGGLYKEEGKIKMLPFHQVFLHTWDVEVEGFGNLEAYPNRDSLAYEAELGLEHIKTIIRGTLRYPGWSETWQQIVHFGLTNEVLRIPNLNNLTYRELTEILLPASSTGSNLVQQVANHLGISPTGKIMDNLKWLGLFSKEKIGINVNTVADVMIHLMQQKLKMPVGARDVVLLVQEIIATFPDENNREEKITSTMIEYGNPNGYTAIAKTVGLPIAIATKLLLTDQLHITGCHIPTHPAVFEPVLKELQANHLKFHEQITPFPVS